MYKTVVYYITLKLFIYSVENSSFFVQKLI